jgi:hypothetical protein
MAHTRWPAPKYFFLICFLFLGILSCSPDKKGLNKNIPSPGHARLPQIYLFWDSANTNLILPWAPPNSDQFLSLATSAASLEARVVLEISSDPAVLETRLQDWNSRPNDLLVVGPSPKLWEKIRSLNLPKSPVSGGRFFLTDSASVKKISPHNDWHLVAIEENPAVEFLSAVCQVKFESIGRGCKFSETARKRPALSKIPGGALGVQFSDFQSPDPTSAPSAHLEMLSLSLAWDQFFRSALRSSTSTAPAGAEIPGPAGRDQALKFTDGTIRLKVAPSLPADVSAAVNHLTLQFLLKD